MSNLKDSNFEDLLIQNKSDSIRDFLIENGKEGKVFCPILFEKEDNKINIEGDNHDC